MTFTLKIKLGNAAMQTGDDISAALRKTAEYLDGSSGQFDKGERGDIRDLNGNTVGSWEVK